MVSTNSTAPAAVTQTPPIVGELERLFDNLDDSALLDLLTGPTRRGPKGHPVEALWRAFITKHYMGLSSTRGLIRTLENNPWVANACGFDWPDIPHEATFSRFFKKLSTPLFLPRVKDVSRALVRQHYATLPAFGKRVAIDSSTLRAWSNGGKKGKKPKKRTNKGYKARVGKVSDKDAGWSVKKNTHGKAEYVFGYKLHLAVDCESELPISANVSAGNVHDSQRASNILSEARTTYSRFKPDYIMADKGYSSDALRKLFYRQYRARPIIDPNPQHKKAVAKTEKTVAWKALYAQRPAVERAYARLKGQRSLNSITVRGRWKVTLHSYLALIVHQAAAFPSQRA